ncbi:uncharacterized protein [Narcine bancroftii]|uniref:uncharacterized protein isoform X3 n=1 Tax=Narcine bancroftii TaxID=1343680 RepID=UPI003831177E
MATTTPSIPSTSPGPCPGPGLTTPLPWTVGRTVTLPCGQVHLPGRDPVIWLRNLTQDVRTLASVTPGARGWGGERAVLLRDPHPYLVIRRLMPEDSGTYTCREGNGIAFTTRLKVHVSEVCIHSDGRNLSRACVQEMDPHDQNGMVTLSCCPGNSVWLRCGGSASPVNQTLHGSRRNSTGDDPSMLFDRASLLPGYGLVFESPPSLIILRPDLPEAGIYICEVKGIRILVGLVVQREGLLSFLLRYWIPLTTLALSLVLFTLSTRILMAINHRREQVAHQTRIAQLLRSFIRRKRNSEILSDPIRGNQQRISLRNASSSTWYENVASANDFEEDDPIVEEIRPSSEIGTLSYENLHAEDDADSEDYLNPDVDSFLSEDYMEPIQEGDPDEDLQEGLDGHSARNYLNPDADSFLSEDYMEPIQKGDLDEDLPDGHLACEPLAAGEDMVSDIVYARPRVKQPEIGGTGEDMEVYEMMAAQQNNHLDQPNDSDEDYEKMDSSDYCNLSERQTSDKE